ncbi:MAG TPA: sigma-70 family RNA polymerase sigma factor [Vicinamibacterales bacterium]|nr:sigma-70 family RNA polymerase sigma factor [Vicinamibacterales bacterium]
MSRMSDSELVVDALDRYERPLIRYAKWLLGDAEMARDVVQETFLRLCREDPARVEGHLAGWLFTVCRNLALDARQKAARSASLAHVEVPVVYDLDEQHDNRQAIGRVLEFLETLPRNQREVVCLKFQGGLSYKEISAITALSTSNVGFLLHTAVRAIRSHLSEHTTGAGHDANQSERSEMDSVRTRRTGQG